MYDTAPILDVSAALALVNPAWATEPDDRTDAVVKGTPVMFNLPAQEPRFVNATEPLRVTMRPTFV